MTRWTREHPSVPGWYWWRQSRESDPSVVHLFVDYEGLWIADPGFVMRTGGEWAGPIPEPEE